MKKSMLYVFVLMAVLLSVTQVNAATYNINGTINRSDTMAGLSGVTVANGTNTTTTNASGFFSIGGMQNNTVSPGWILTVTAPNDGYNGATIYAIIDAADNTTAKANLTLVTPTISGVTEASITRIGATISWTPSISTIGNRMIYTHDSALTNNLWTSDWSNSTTTPSFTLSGLDIFTTYYYRVQSYNNNNATYSATSDGDFKTLAGNPEDEPEAYELVSQPVSPSAPSSIVTQAQGQVAKSQTTKVIVFVAIILVLYLVLSGGKGKGRK